MKKQLLTITCFLLLTATAFCQSLKINADKAIVDFNFVSEKTVGTVKGIDAKINFDASKLAVSSIEGSADITTLSTENNMRDKHLQQEDMFNAEKFPTMDFKSTSIVKTEKGFAMQGLLSIKGTEKETLINFTYKDKTFIGKTIIYSNDFDVFSRKKREDSKVLVKMTIPIL
ncbi:MAG: YceI family protein [Parvicellaceae bacterium]